MSSSTDQDFQVLSPTITAKRLGIHKNTLRKYTREGIGPEAVTLGPGRIGYLATEVCDWLASQQQEARMGHDELEHAALTVLAAVKKKIIDNDPEAMITTLRGSSREVSLRLAEATNIIAHLCKLSGQPEATLAALVESVTKAAD